MQGSTVRGRSAEGFGRPEGSANLLPVDNYDLESFGALAASLDGAHFRYVVTPNVDQIIRYHEDPQFRQIYADATYVLLDSRFLARWLAIVRGQRLRVCTGSDLATYLLERVSGKDDRIVLVGARSAQARRVSAQFGLRDLVHIDPPMGFIDDSDEVERCLQQIEAASPFRYCFLAVGSPQQELLAWQLQRRERARGLALCVGASINFLTGVERRAPRWMQQAGIEWLFRLLQDPARLARRYLVRGPRIFVLLPKLRIVLRRQGSSLIS